VNDDGGAMKRCHRHGCCCNVVAGEACGGGGVENEGIRVFLFIQFCS
jgi:hypothetical protein